MKSSLNRFRAEAFLEWANQLRVSIKQSERLHRFQPLWGLHMTRFAGGSSEFLDYHEYQPGDDPRLLAPRLFARTRRWYVKRMHHRSPLRFLFVLDGTRSMFFPPAPENDLEQKWVQQNYLAAVFIRELLQRGDLCHVRLQGENGYAHFRLHRMTDYYTFLKKLEDWHPDQSPISGELSMTQGLSSVLVFSDLLSEKDLESFLNPLKHLSQGTSCVLKIRHPLEQSGELPNDIIVEDLEHRMASKFHSLNDPPNYQKARHQFDIRIQRHIRDLSGKYISLIIHENPHLMHETMAALIRWGDSV